MIQLELIFVYGVRYGSEYIVVARGFYSTCSVVVGHGLRALCMWNLTGPAVEPMFAALAGRLLTTGLPGKCSIMF